MSFDQLSSLESGTGGGGSGSSRRNNGGGGNNNNGSPAPPYHDDPEFSRQANELTTALFRLAGNNARLRTEVGNLTNSRRDTARVSERVHSLLEESRALFKTVGEGVKRIQVWEDVTPTQKYTQQKLSREFQTTLSEFQTLQRSALEKDRASVTAARATIESAQEDEASASAGGQQQLQQQQELTRLAAQDEVDFQEALIVEREEEIRNIEQGVTDLNVLFQQVAQIVGEQGEQLNTIADNVENVRSDTRGADYELRSAARYQRNARGKACCLLLVLAVILLIVLLAVFLG